MPVRFVSGDLFLSGAQTLAHGVSCRGRMGAGIAVEFKRQHPVMFQEYRRRCRAGGLQPGEIFLWKSPGRWILNLATQDALRGSRLQYVETALRNVANTYEREGIQSIAMPQIASGLGGLSWSEVRPVIEQELGPLRIPIFVYEHFVAQSPAHEESDEIAAAVDDSAGEAIIFYRPRDPEYGFLSNFYVSELRLGGKTYRTVEHYFQAMKADDEYHHELVRNQQSPSEAKKLGRSIPYRNDWESVKLEIMRAALTAKFQQDPNLGRKLLATGNRPLHEDAPHDPIWGWANGQGADLLGKLLMRVRAALIEEETY